jgi:hypothetical protein
MRNLYLTPITSGETNVQLSPLVGAPSGWPERTGKIISTKLVPLVM